MRATMEAPLSAQAAWRTNRLEFCHTCPSCRKPAHLFRLAGRGGRPHPARAILDGRDPRSYVEDDRDRAVVHERDLHLRAEDASRNRYAFALERRAEEVVERFCDLGIRGSGEARAIALP